MSCEDYVVVTKMYLGHDNTVILIPYSNIVERVNYDMTAVTEVQASADLTSSAATGDDITASSDDSPITVWWALVGTEWRIYLKVGMFVSMAAGEYKVRVVIVEPSFPNGLVLTDDLLVEVVEIP